MSAIEDMWIAQSLHAGRAHHEKGQLAEAEALYRQILSRRPDYPPALHRLGLIAHQTGHADEAMQLIARAVLLDPNRASYHNDLGIALAVKGRYEEAFTAFRTAIRLDPDHDDAHYNLGLLLAAQRKVDEAIVSYRRALQLRPERADAWCNLANMLKDAGQLDEAIDCYRRAIALRSDKAIYADNLIFALHYHADFDSRRIREEHSLWQERFARPLERFIQPHRNDPSPERRLRVGYVSPHFFSQAECFFVLPLLEAHDRERFQVHAYASVVTPDAVTERYKESFDGWHDVRGLTDAALVDRIRADGIDVLVDLTMHMSGSRLGAFAVKPAPVQVSWLAYPGSGGLDAIEYRLSDRFIDPPGEEESWSFEKPVRLPDCWCCYEPVGGGPEVNDLPAIESGHVTFAALNNPCKVNDGVLELWARVMNEVAGSRLLMMHPSADGRERVARSLEAQGISRERVQFIAWMPRQDYLRLYHRADLALDTFPYNGITTTCDALWMGVPVLTLPGNVPQSRAGRGLLSAVGLDQFVATTPQDFGRIAATWSRDLPRLAELRRTLRGKTLASPLMDAQRFARNVETAYRDMWRRWCENRA